MPNTLIINGKTYNSIDEMPPDVRATFESTSKLLGDQNQNGMPDFIENMANVNATVIQTSKIIFEGKAYDSVEELPAEARAKYEQAMGKLADENKNGVPDVIENAVKDAPTFVTTQFSAGASPRHLQSAPASNLGPIIVLAIVAIGLAIIVAILLLLLLNKG